MSQQKTYPGGYVEQHGDKPAYIMAGTGETVTYRELHERACRISQLIRSCGIQPGEHVAWCMENHPWFLSLAWGALYAGVYFTAISSRLTTEEVAVRYRPRIGTSKITGTLAGTLRAGFKILGWILVWRLRLPARRR